MVSSRFAGAKNGQAAASDPGLYFSNHIHGQQNNLSNLVQSQISVNNPVGLKQVVQPVSNNLPQPTHPVLGNPNTGSVVPVTSEHNFAPTTSADVPSGVVPFVPASTTTNQVSLSHQTTGSIVAGYQAPVIPSQQHMGVPVSSYNFSSDHYNPYSNLWRPAIASPSMSAQQHYVSSTTVFSAATPIVPNNFVPYTSGGTVFFAQPENFSHANQPVVPD